VMATVTATAADPATAEAMTADPVMGNNEILEDVEVKLWP
jgi:hypothetical protein